VIAFFDTNILVYAQETNGKGDHARALLAGGGKLSVQVLNEFTAVSRRKQQRDWEEIAEAISDVLTVVDPPLVLTLDLHAAARTLAEDHQLSLPPPSRPVATRCSARTCSMAAASADLPSLIRF
jgi:predicted nucleic acid-binding protein